MTEHAAGTRCPSNFDPKLDQKLGIHLHGLVIEYATFVCFLTVDDIRAPFSILVYIC